MKKILLLLFALCSLAAQAQFQNPFHHKRGEFCEFGIAVALMHGDDPMTAATIYLPKDTILPRGLFAITANAIWYGGKEYTDADVEFLKTITADVQIQDYYGRCVEDEEGKPMESSMHFENESTSLDFLGYVVEGGYFDYPMGLDCGIEIGGHYYWSWTANNGIEGMSGHVQLNAAPTNFVWGVNEKGEDELKEYDKLIVRSKFNTGFPYDIAKYQGKAKYTVYNPDSIIICQREIDLRVSPDSTMRGQVQRDIVCEIDSVRHGKYIVAFEAPFLEKSQEWVIEVKDPLANASSANPVNATYRFAESNFKEAGKGKGWKYRGSVKPSYYTDPKVSRESVMAIRPDADSAGNGFSLTQSVGKMPQGFYKLTMPVAYQPCSLTDMQGNVEILASFEANGYTKKAKHIMAGAKVETTTINGMEYKSYAIPSSDEAFADCMHKYAQEIIFEVKEDSLVTIGVHKNHTDSLNEITVIGAVELMYYGAGLPYGKVVFPEGTEFAAGDSINTTVQLYDGVGQKVFSDNKIFLFIAPLTEEGATIRELVIADKEIAATKAGAYKIPVVLPEDIEYPSGEYALYVGSLLHDGKYEVLERTVINVKGTEATAIQEVKSTIRDAAPVYNISGVRQNSNSAAKGIYIQSGKTFVKQ